MLAGLLVVAFVAVLFCGLVTPEDDDSEKINAAFNCLDERVAATSISLEEAVFAALTKVPGTKAADKIEQEKSSSADCWPKSGCGVKESAQAALAKLSMGESVEEITAWLVTKSGMPKELTWYLQISIGDNGPATCVVNYDGSDHSVSVNEEMKLSGSAGSCFNLANSDYWLKIKTNCLEKEFNIQCDKEFKTNLLYEKSSGGTIYVSSQTHGASSGAWTVEAITARCFREGNDCDYEASLWGAVALYANGEDVSEFAPYLRALSSENGKYFPSAFLVAILEGGENHYSKIIENQRARPEGAYWEMPNTPHNKYYDTALGMLALGGAGSSEITNANTIGYLFKKQDASGCWNNNNIRDTAFLIYAAQWLRGTGGGVECYINSDCSEGYVCEDGNCVSEAVLECNNNGVMNDSEQCDGNDFGTFSDGVGQCDEYNSGFTGGDLICEDCKINTTQCTGTGPPPVVNGSTGNGTDDESYDPNMITDCELANLFCAPSRASCLENGGSFYPQETHACADHYEFCCTVETPELPNCFSLGGSVCAYEEECGGAVQQASDGACCLDICELTGTTGCSLDSDCLSGETCQSGACVYSGSSSNGGGGDDDEGGSSLWIWIVILLILIGLVVLGIIYRDKIRVWWFKFRGKAKTSKVPPGRPPGMNSLIRRPTPRFMPQGMRTMPEPQRAPPKQMSKKDKEMEETFKKLKEIGE